MKKERRWLKSVIAASETSQIAMPWQRCVRRKPEAMKPQSALKSQAQAAR